MKCSRDDAQLNEELDSLYKQGRSLSDCTCSWNPTLLSSQHRFPCLLHGYVYATKKRRIEMLEARVAALEELFERRPG